MKPIKIGPDELKAGLKKATEEQRNYMTDMLEKLDEPSQRSFVNQILEGTGVNADDLKKEVALYLKKMPKP